MTSEYKRALQCSIAAGVSYILSRQNQDGSWVDWQLPPGESRHWTTAFVGYKLRPLSSYSGVKSAVRAAACWLLKNRLADEGWGYNQIVGSDADSTGYAILLLSCSGEPVPEKSYTRLTEFQRSDGGFATYLPEGNLNSWVVSHPDVTPVALLALLTRYGREHPVVQRGLEYAARQVTPKGLWNSFWWDSFLYSTDANLALLNAVACPVDAANTRDSLTQSNSAKAFELALRISSLLSSHATSSEQEIHRVVNRWVYQLVRNQEPNGSWRSEPILRVTNRDCYEPWRCREPGPLFADPNRLFTSATVLEALARVYYRCFSGESGADVTVRERMKLDKAQAKTLQFVPDHWAQASGSGVN